MNENKWFWCADWCKKNNLNPMHPPNWDKAKEKYESSESQKYVECQICEGKAKQTQEYYEYQPAEINSIIGIGITFGNKCLDCGSDYYTAEDIRNTNNHQKAMLAWYNIQNSRKEL